MGWPCCSIHRSRQGFVMPTFLQHTVWSRPSVYGKLHIGVGVKNARQNPPPSSFIVPRQNPFCYFLDQNHFSN